MDLEIIYINEFGLISFHLFLLCSIFMHCCGWYPFSLLLLSLVSINKKLIRSEYPIVQMHNMQIKLATNHSLSHYNCFLDETD